MTVHTYGEPPDKPVKRKCRWCGRRVQDPTRLPEADGVP